jgi:hypothetical protein
MNIYLPDCFYWVCSFGHDADGYPRDRSMVFATHTDLPIQIIVDRAEQYFLALNPGSAIKHRRIVQISQADFDAFDPYDAQMHADWKVRFLGSSVN